MDWFWATLFVISSFFNGRAAFKLLLDWKGMLTTCRFVEEAYERVEARPDEAALARDPDAPVFLHLVPAYQEPDIGITLRALLGSRYPDSKLHVAVITKEEEDQAPHPSMEASTAELVRRFRLPLPPLQQKIRSLLVMPGRARKAHQLNWALRPDNLAAVLGDGVDASRIWVGVSDADSIPDRNAFRWIAADVVHDGGHEAYQGVTLSLANYDRLDVRGRVGAIQQSSIFIRVSIARPISERRRLRGFAAPAGHAPGLARVSRPGVERRVRRRQRSEERRVGKECR